MSTEPGKHRSAPPRSARTVRPVRPIARTVLALDVVVLLVVLIRLGSVDLNDHPGLVATLQLTIAIFVIASPS